MQDYFKNPWTLDDDSRLFVLTGAGISAESGIKTFRDAGGLWEGHAIEEVATPEGFAENPSLVIDFYNQRRKQLKEVEPNLAHIKLAELMKKMGERMLIVTQNVDDLHERGGAKNVIHMHGELKKLKCHGSPPHIIPTDHDQSTDQRCNSCGMSLRPDIVWFGEMPYRMEEIYSWLESTTHFITIGTSSVVYPAAGFKQVAKQAGASVLCINLEVDPYDTSLDFYIEDKATTGVRRFVDLISGAGS